MIKKRQLVLNLKKKRKIGVERRLFDKEWCHKYFVIEQNHSSMCAICHFKISTLTEYKIKQHYATIHAEYEDINGQSRIDKYDQSVKSVQMLLK